MHTEPARSRDLERLLTFVDAVVAIAITLLVLPLVDLAAELGAGESASDLLADNAALAGSAALSFAVIAQLWLTQHRVLRDVVAEDHVLTRVLLLWLLTIVALPFPTALLPEAGDQSLTKILYIGTIALSSACLAGMAWRVAGTPGVRDAGRPPSAVPGAVATSTLLVALAISLAVPAAGYWPLLLLFVTGPAADRLAGRQAGPRRDHRPAS